MRKRILIFVLDVLVVCALSTSALAKTVTKTGKTGTGSSGTLNTLGSLYIDGSHARAETWAGSNDGVTLETTVNLCYINSNGHEQWVGDSGSDYAIATGDPMKALRAISTHEVDGGIRWGSWTAEISASWVS